MDDYGTQQVRLGFPLQHDTRLTRRRNTVNEERDRLMGVVQYWEDLYTGRYAEKFFDWYQSWEVLGPLLSPKLSAADRVLMVGCGNSTLSQRLWESGIRHITNIDFSPAVIRFMREKSEREMPDMRWEVQDATALRFDPSAFSVVIDKGTLDSLCCRLDAPEQATLLSASVRRVLRRGGLFIVVSFDARRLALLGKGWRQEALERLAFYDAVHKRDDAHYVYFLRLVDDADDGVPPPALPLPPTSAPL
jgi:EEF1A lysine methyltransferase 4